MARTYKLLSSGPHPANPLNVTTTVEVTDSDTGEVLLLKDRIFGSDLTADKLAEQIGLIEVNVMVPRAAAMAELAALKGQSITPTSPPVIDPKRLAYQTALQALAAAEQLVKLKVITESDKEYTDALAAVKAAKAEL